jgi:Protein of unknown function (DUF2971)
MNDASKYVTADDLKKYDGFVTHHLKHIAVIPDCPLQHYTTGDTLIKIVRSGEMWSTQLSCLNDMKEFVFAIEELLKITRIRITENTDPDVDLLLRIVEKELQTPNKEGVGIFVLCFSKNKDDLSQWRAYGAGEGGYAIEFDPKELGLAAMRRQNAYLVKVEYDQDRQKLLLNDILDWTIKFYKEGLLEKNPSSKEEWIKEFLKAWADKVTAFAACLKHRSFKSEDEWRLLHFCVEGDVRKMHFLQKHSMMTRHIPIVFPEDEQGRSRLPISSVMVGPSRHKEVSVVSVGDLLAAYDYKVPISETDIPYRLI